MKISRMFRLSLLAAFIFFVGTLDAVAAPSGAIFTTDANSAFVNANVYDDKGDVYLNGGPRPNAPCTAAGLPDGDYYFQVTDPSGNVLLSNDDVNERKVSVLGGVIVAYLGTTHITGAGKCPGSITVQLVTYNDTPNPGGEYKVWMTRVPDYDTTQTLVGPFGFIPSKSKTDNFKVLPLVDTDGDGVPDVDDADDDNDNIPDEEDTCPLDPDPNCGIIIG